MKTSSEKMYKCKFCRFSCSRHDNVIRHEKKHTTGKVECKNCKKKMSQTSLKRHMDTACRANEVPPQDLHFESQEEYLEEEVELQIEPEPKEVGNISIENISDTSSSDTGSSCASTLNAESIVDSTVTENGNKLFIKIEHLVEIEKAEDGNLLIRSNDIEIGGLLFRLTCVNDPKNAV